MGGTDSIWLASDQGLSRLIASGEGVDRIWAWDLMGADLLPDADVYGLYRDNLDRVWVSTAAGVVRFVDGMVEKTFDQLPDLGGFRDAGAAADGGTWLLGANGAALIDATDMVVTITFPPNI